MKIQVYKCRFTGGIFSLENKDNYILHLKELRKTMKADRKYKRTKQKFESWLAEEKEKITHIDMIVPWILENQKKLMNAHNDVKDSHWGGKFFLNTDEFTSIILKTSYNYNVSNSHSSPKVGVENWCNRNKDLPSGYPGFAGSIEGTLKRDLENSGRYPSSALLKMIGIHTGTGGGGNIGWRYDVKLFIADWPGLGKQLVVDRLKGTT